jgi:cysteine desulfurase NifS
VTERRGICGICPAGCWVKVGVDDGRLVSIDADEGHPLGMLCRRGEAAPEIVHSEHRLRHPLRRAGRKGGYDFQRITWDEAYDEIIDRLQTIREQSGPEAVSIYTGRGAFELSLCDVFQPKEAAVSSASSVLFPFGSPNTMGVGALCYVSFAMIAPHLTMGRMLIDMYTDIEGADLLVVWGANPATDSPPLDMHRLEAARRRGAEVVVIDPRRTETAVRTGAEWVPIRPGTDGALALGMLDVMISEELYDEAFATDWTLGFDELAGYVHHFSPEVVEATTGVPANTVRSLARRICAADGAAPVMYTGLEYSDSGVQAIRAVITLFALAGHLDVPGGIGLAMNGSHFPINRSQVIANPDLGRAVARDRFPIYSDYRGESHAVGLVDAVLHGDPYPIRALLIHGASILTSWPQTAIWREALAGLDFVVSIDRKLTADAAWADIVLPATTMFEITSYMTYGPIFRLRERLVPPVGEARNDYLIMAEFAHRLGYGDLYPQTEDELLRHVLKGSGFTLEQVREAGGTVKIPSPMMEYKKWEKGGLRPDGEPGFDTPSGRFEIHSTILEDHGYEPLPRYTEPSEGPLAAPSLAREYPLVFNSGARRQSYFRSQHHGVAGLAEHHPEPLVEINPHDAGARGIATGDLVEVRSARGAARFRALVTDDIVAGAVECDMGGGGPQGSSAWQGCNVNELTDLGNLDPISGFPVYKSLLCQVAKVEAGSETTRRAATVSSDLDAGDAMSACAVPEQRPREIPLEERINLDNNATTAIHPKVHEVMRPFLEAEYGNPSSIHGAGKVAKDAVEKARRRVARLIGARPRRIVFTGGGSEADNLALKGIALRRPGGGLVTTNVEHPAVFQCCRFLERLGYPVTYLEVDGDGRLDPARLEEFFARAEAAGTVVLVSVMAANNEVGTLFPIRELAEITHLHGALFHTDAVQAAGKVPIDVEQLDVDLLTISGHKIHGPKGVGALYVRRGVELEPLVHGGQQEAGLRAGTENVTAIAGFGRAAELARVEFLPKMAEVARLRDLLQARLQGLVDGARVNGPLDGDQRLPNTLNMTLPGLRGESLVIAMDHKGVALSSGSACKSGSPEPSHALLAMGLSDEQAHCSVRFSLSESTTEEQILRTVETLAQVLDEMESTVRFLPCK